LQYIFYNTAIYFEEREKHGRSILYLHSGDDLYHTSKRRNSHLSQPAWLATRAVADQLCARRLPI